MKLYLTEWKIFKERHFLLSFLLSLFLLLASLVINFIAGTYATEKVSNPVTDIILSNTRVHEVDGIFVYGSIIILIFILLAVLCNPKSIPFTIKSIALFVIIRSVFISLTHLGPFPNETVVTVGNFLSKFTFGGDLFFSGHTGLPFLMALIFWNKKFLGYFFFVISLIFGTVVLLGHLHYSIDVLAAFFITYTIFDIAKFVFKADYLSFIEN